MKHHKIRFSGFLLGVLKLKQQVPTAQSVSESSWVSTRFLCSAQQDKWQTSKINSGWSWCLGKDNVNCHSILSCFSQAMSLFERLSWSQDWKSVHILWIIIIIVIIITLNERGGIYTMDYNFLFWNLCIPTMDYNFIFEIYAYQGTPPAIKKIFF